MIDDACWKQVWAEMTVSEMEDRRSFYERPRADAERRGQHGMVERARAKAETTPAAKCGVKASRRQLRSLGDNLLACQRNPDHPAKKNPPTPEPTPKPATTSRAYEEPAFAARLLMVLTPMRRQCIVRIASLVSAFTLAPFNRKKKRGLVSGALNANCRGHRHLSPKGFFPNTTLIGVHLVKSWSEPRFDASARECSP